LKKFNHEHHQRNLGENEAYLYDALVAPAFRGQGIVLFMRFKFYELLEKLSKNIFLSYTDCANTPAVRFKQKLGARLLELCLYINLWNKFSGHWILRDYSSNPTNIYTRR
jgi:GNAT superfamily N-acetyltransferase